MEKFDILLWAIGGGFAGTWTIMFYMLKELKDLRKDVHDIDCRLCRLEGAFAAKDFCALRHQHTEKVS